MSPPCMRCHRLTPTLSYGGGLWLCPRCPVADPACDEFQHEYRARDGLGVWICLRCGTAKTSQTITTGVVPADQWTSSDIA